MSKIFKKFVPDKRPDKNVTTNISVPNIYIDKIKALVKSGEYGKLEQELKNTPIKLFGSDILFEIIQSELTETQKLHIITLLLKRGLSINILDENNLPLIYYSVKLQLYDITNLLIQKGAKLNLKLPKGYDLFQTVLTPNIMKCPSELINVQDQVMISKYYSQVSEIERDFRNDIYKLPITKRIITYLLRFVEEYPLKTIKYFDREEDITTSNKLVKETLNTKELADNMIDWENKITNQIETINNEINKKINDGSLNQEQIILQVSLLVQNLKSKFTEELKVNDVKSFPSNNDNFILSPDDYNPPVIPPAVPPVPPVYDYKKIYNKIYTFDNNKYNIDNIFTNFVNKYTDQNTGKYAMLLNYFNEFQSELTTKMNELVNLEEKIMALYPIFSPGTKDITPRIFNVIRNKINLRLFKIRNPPNLNQEIIDRPDYINIVNYRGGNLIGGAENNLIILNKQITEILKERDPPVVGVPRPDILSDVDLINRVNQTLNNLFPGFSTNVPPELRVLVGIAGVQPRPEIIKLNNELSNVNGLLENLNEYGNQINNLLNFKILNIALINEYKNKYRNVLNQFMRIGDNINQIKYNINDPNLNNSINKLLNYILNINNENILDRPPIVNNRYINININDLIIRFNGYIQNLQQGNPAIQGDGLYNLFRDPQKNLDVAHQADNTKIILLLYKRFIFYQNLCISTIFKMISSSYLHEQCNNDFQDLTRFNIINPIITPQIIENRTKLLSDFKTKYDAFYEFIQESQQLIEFNMKQFNELIIDVNNISRIYLLNYQFNPPPPPPAVLAPNIPNPSSILMLNEELLLINPNEIDIDDDNINDIYNKFRDNIDFYSVKDNLCIYLDPVVLPYGDNGPIVLKKLIGANPPNQLYNYNLNANILNNQPFDLTDNNPNLYNPILMDYNHLKIIEIIFHKIVYNEIMKNPNYQNNIVQNYARKNPEIKQEILELILLKTLNKAISYTFYDIADNVTYLASNNLIKNKLIKQRAPPVKSDVDYVLERLQKITKKTNINRNTNNNIYYLDENYSNGEPIDVLPCINNNDQLIKLIQKKLHPDLKKYIEIVCKLGSVNILNTLNMNTKNKIQKEDIQMYILRHDEVFKKDIDFLQNQLKDELKKNELDIFYTNSNNNTDLNTLTKINLPLNLISNIIYYDLINTQKYCNRYLEKNIKIKVSELFEKYIIPKLQEFLKYFTDTVLNFRIDYTIMKPQLDPLIDNLINHYLNVNPLKAREAKVSLEDIITTFTTIFIGELDEETKTSIFTIYDEKFKNKLQELLRIMSNYYLNVYRNHIRYIFNTVRYQRLANSL